MRGNVLRCGLTQALQKGQTVTITNNGVWMGPEIIITVCGDSDCLDYRFHTSCSIELYPGVQLGAFIVRSGSFTSGSGATTPLDDSCIPTTAAHRRSQLMSKGNGAKRLGSPRARQVDDGGIELKGQIEMDTVLYGFQGIKCDRGTNAENPTITCCFATSASTWETVCHARALCFFVSNSRWRSTSTPRT